MSAFRRVVQIATMLVGCATSGAYAQAPVTLAVSAGSATDQRGVRSDAMTVSPTFVLAPTGWWSLSLSGNYTRFQNEVWQYGGAAAVGMRTELFGGSALTLNGGVDASKSSFNATFLTTDVTPALEWSGGPITLFGGAHYATGQTTITQTTSGPLPGPLPGPTQLVTQSRNTIGPVYGLQLRAGGFGWPTATLGLRAEDGQLSMGGPQVNDRVASLTVVTGPLTLSGAVGQRRAVDESMDFGGGGASLRVLDRMSIDVGAGSYPSNRVLGSSGGRYASAGLSFRIGGGGGAPEFPQPVGADRPRTGVTRLAIRAPNAQTVELAGDWNGWVPVPAWASANGVWYVDADLAPGEYRYAFRVDGKEWRVPPGATAVDDGFGGRSAYVVVRGTQSGTK